MSRRESALSDPRQARYGSEEQRVTPPDSRDRALLGLRIA